MTLPFACYRRSVLVFEIPANTVRIVIVNSAYSWASATTYALVLDASSSNPCKLHKKGKNKVRINRKRKRKIVEIQDGSSFLNHFVRKVFFVS